MRLNGWSRSVMAEKICFYFGDQSVSQCIEIVERKKGGIGMYSTYDYSLAYRWWKWLFG